MLRGASLSLIPCQPHADTQPPPTFGGGLPQAHTDTAALLTAANSNAQTQDSTQQHHWNHCIMMPLSARSSRYNLAVQQSATNPAWQSIGIGTKHVAAALVQPTAGSSICMVVRAGGQNCTAYATATWAAALPFHKGSTAKTAPPPAHTMFSKLQMQPCTPQACWQSPV
ncbi:hypothetical protein COO60DRAFT_586373 [Scenedesmus sp. NREL 46B-D3]|nr:hypothetical protein COO60DRAFT_586373 [Scenedesmus sp. NREL 46B-D3]